MELEGSRIGVLPYILVALNTCFHISIYDIDMGAWGVKWGLMDPYRTLFAPLEVLYRTKFGSKYHIMVQLANVYKVGITDHFLDLSGHYQGPLKDDFMAKKAILRPQIVPNPAICPLKWSSDGLNWSDMVQNNPFWYYEPSDDHFRGQKARFGTIWGLKMDCLAMKLPLGAPGSSPKDPKTGQ